MSYTLSVISPFHSNAASYLATHSRGVAGNLLSSLARELAGDYGYQPGLTYDDKEGLFQIELDVAGFKREEITIEATEDGVLTITADSKRRGKATRSYYLDGANTDGITAKLEDGILSVVVPKKPENLPKRVEIG